MTRLPKKRGITQVEEDKSLILRQNYGISIVIIIRWSTNYGESKNED
jgi:hypothetical protein